MSSATSSRNPRYSVIIVTYNSLENIRVCLDSLRRCGGADGAHADGMHEYIVVDNDSRDGTGKYLSAQSDVRAILNTENNGFSKGCNQGAAIAKGEFVLFLNPDTLVTPGWSDTMARHFQDPSVGAVGPVSNYVAGLQRLDLNLPAEWRNATSFPGQGAVEVADNLSRILKQGNSGKGVTTRLLIGFCLMMPRSLYESMDGMDENLFLGNDDLDLSWRLRNAGRKLVVASDAFIFHEGQKSFKTESKSTVDRLTQESTDAMYVKLVHHYGGRDKVPAPVELWGIGWFNPSPSLLQGAIPALPAHAGLAKNVTADPPRRIEIKHESETNVKSESTAWKAITALVFVGPDADAPGCEPAPARLERTLATLPARPGVEIIVLNCSGTGAGAEAPAGANLRKLDLGSGIPLKQALEFALALLPGSHVLFCLAGVEFSTLFNHWMDKQDLAAIGASLPLPLRIGAEDKGAASPAFAFLGRKEWLRDAVASMPTGETIKGLTALGDRLVRDEAARPAPSKPIDPPWLLARKTDLPAISASESAAPAPSAKTAPSWTPVANVAAKESASPAFPQPGQSADAFNLYPESLRANLREAKQIGFAGTTAEIPAKSGPFRVFDPKGNLLPVSNQDLIILRVTPDLIDGLSERMANIRRLAPGLKRFVAVFNGADARRLPAASALAPVDLTPEGMRTALWRAGFAVTGERPYVGFPNGTSQASDLQGWTQVEAVPRSTAHQTEKMVSIVILGFNQVEYTRKCIESIRKYTRQKYELILVDNGSKDGTEAFFRSIPGAKVIRNAENLGVSKGWNQGMRLAAGEYILILNNDIIVGPDWLENMVRLAESDPSIGLVGPRSNYIAGPQVVADVPYKAEGEIQDFIRKWQGEHALSAAEFGFIKGFCHLIPRRVFAKVGFYDERFGKGNFEDDDYCMRVRVHGFRALFADDVFIHHYGSVSFNQESVDWRALMVENQKRYEQKWAKGASAVHDTQVSDPDAISSPTSPSSPKAPPGVAEKLEQGRQAYENGDLKRARALFLDAQTSDPQDPEPYCCLGALMFSEGSVQEAVSFLMRCLNLNPAHADAAQNLLDTFSARNGKVTKEEVSALLSRYPSNRVFADAHTAFERPAWTPVPAAPELPAWRKEAEGLIEARKYASAMDLLENRVKRNEDPGACYNYLGIIAHACGDADLALGNFSAALQHSPGEADILFNLSDTLLAVGRSGEAAKLLEDSARKSGVETDPDLPDLAATAEQIRHAMSRGIVKADVLLASRDANQQAERLLRTGAFAEAKAFLDAALESDSQDFRAINNLGLLAWYQENGEEARRNFHRCLAIRPAWPDALINAFDTALALGDIKAFVPCLEKALDAAPAHTQALAMRKHIQAQGPVIHCFKSFEELEANQALLVKAETAMEQARLGDAIIAYLDAVKLQPQNPQAFNGLGIIAFGEKRHADAFGLFDAAAGLHPMDQDILMNFWQCAQALRREGEVLPKLKDSLERNPALEDVKAVIKEYA